jgi:hypothetical protein
LQSLLTIIGISILCTGFTRKKYALPKELFI